MVNIMSPQKTQRPMHPAEMRNPRSRGQGQQCAKNEAALDLSGVLAQLRTNGAICLQGEMNNFEPQVQQQYRNNTQPWTYQTPPESISPASTPPSQRQDQLGQGNPGPQVIAAMADQLGLQIRLMQQSRQQQPEQDSLSALAQTMTMLMRQPHLDHSSQAVLAQAIQSMAAQPQLHQSYQKILGQAIAVMSMQPQLDPSFQAILVQAISSTVCQPHLDQGCQALLRQAMSVLSGQLMVCMQTIGPATAGMQRSHQISSAMLSNQILSHELAAAPPKAVSPSSKNSPSKKACQINPQKEPESAVNHNSMRNHLVDVEREDPMCVFVAKNIRGLGFKSKEALKKHYSTYGVVSRVLVASSKVKVRDQMASNRPRLRPGCLGLVVMQSPEAVRRIMAEGSEQTINGHRIVVFMFEKKEHQRSENGSEHEESTCDPSEGRLINATPHSPSESPALGNWAHATKAPLSIECVTDEATNVGASSASSDNDTLLAPYGMPLSIVNDVNELDFEADFPDSTIPWNRLTTPDDFFF